MKELWIDKRPIYKEMVLNHIDKDATGITQSYLTFNCEKCSKKKVFPKDKMLSYVFSRFNKLKISDDRTKVEYIIEYKDGIINMCDFYSWYKGECECYKVNIRELIKYTDERDDVWIVMDESIRSKLKFWFATIEPYFIIWYISPFLSYAGLPYIGVPFGIGMTYLMIHDLLIPTVNKKGVLFIIGVHLAMYIPVVYNHYYNKK